MAVGLTTLWAKRSNDSNWQVPHILDTVVQTVWVDLGR